MLFFELFSLNLSRLFHCSVIKVLAAFCCRFLLTAVCVSSFIISCVQVFVNNFFNFSNKLFSNCLWICTVSRYSRWQLVYHTISSNICQHLFLSFLSFKNVNIKFDIFSCFYRFAILHNTQPVLLYIFTFRQRNSKAATAANLSRSLFPFLCKLLYLFLE